ncbi:hypothetical protein [Ottowia testudinis]|uniref:DUF4230 domain-containing protein n=1 Tax=Ottowia testudinis TaxID=2816950 RepID=A0A975H631_9BURK|nr:hypothetical protein [Ottowia testudinis]QTD45587.1 hypothetical protein J1M35_01270 [Ottowia testudinis]
MTPEDAAPATRVRPWRGGLLPGLLAIALLAWWLWRAAPPAPPPAATVGEAVVLRTPGGRLEISEIQQTESFEVTRDHTVLGVPVGSTFSRIRVPAHYRYHVELAPEWRVTVQPGGGVRVIAPRVRPTLPVAIDTARIGKEARGLWSLFTGPEQLAALEKSITASLATKAASAPMLARQREAARATVGEFVQKWLMAQTDWKPHAGQKIEVLFADEPIDALDAACGGRPGCAAERLNAAGL